MIACLSETFAMAVSGPEAHLVDAQSREHVGRQFDLTFDLGQFYGAASYFRGLSTVLFFEE